MPFCAVRISVCGPEDRSDLGGDRRDLMRLHAEDDEIGLAKIGDALARGDARDDLPALLFQHEAALADGGKVGPPRDDADLLARRGEPGRQQAADRPDADHANLHLKPSLRAFSRLARACPAAPQAQNLGSPPPRANRLDRAAPGAR